MENQLAENGLSIQKTEKISKNKKSPSISFPQNNCFYEEAKIYVSENFGNHYGELTDYQIYPTTFSEAEIWLENFLENRF